MAIWPFIPDKAEREVLSFNTDVTRAYSAEKRRSLRNGRHAMGCNYTLRSDEFARAQELLCGDALGMFDVPVWPEMSRAGVVADTDTVITADTDADYSSLRALLFGACDDVLAVDIDTVGAGSLTLTGQTGQTFANAAVLPLKTATAPGGMTLNRVSRGFHSVSIEWLVDEAPDLGATSLPQYLGIDVFKCAGVVIEPLAGSVRQPNVVIDSGLGAVTLEPSRSLLDKRYSMSIVSNTMALRWERKQWFHHLRGRDGEFWVPSWGGDMTLVDPIGAADISILVAPKFANVADYAGRHLFLADGIIREITSAIDELGNHRLTIAATGQALPVTQSLNLMSKVRLDTDRIEIEHLRGAWATSRLVIVEV